MTTTVILQQEFEALRADLIAKYDELGMRTTGNWADSLEVVVSENKAVILGVPYSQQLESGRVPGKQPPSQMIEQWIKDKGIASRIEGKISISSLAYLIARKIGREGWKREDHGGVELISQVVTPERIQSILDRLSDIYVTDFTNDLINYLQAA
jgi:hypothetical protein